jgi:DNA-binding NtrC family response regulator
MSLRMQPALLRFLETGEIQRVGADRRGRPLDVRIVAASNRDLMTQIAAGEFRADLYYRLNVIHLVVPPLRERREDVPLLVAHFARECASVYGVEPPVIPAEALDCLCAYRWPGNVRELRNVMERLVVRRAGARLAPADLPEEIAAVARARDEATPAVADRLWTAVVDGGESFWTVVYEPFLKRDLTRRDVRALVKRGLQRTGGSYKELLALFHLAERDYKRFLNALQTHGCRVPPHEFRAVSSGAADSRPSPGTLPSRSAV